MIRIAFIATLVLGCSPQQKCVSATTKLAKKAESCGIAVAVPKETIEKNCAAAYAASGAAGAAVDLARTEHFLEADTCEGLKLRLDAYVKQEMAEMAAKAAEKARVEEEAEEAQAKKANEDAFNQAFKEQVTKSQHGGDAK